jgi:exodeoxyribonuclease VII large subunit
MDPLGSRSTIDDVETAELPANLTTDELVPIEDVTSELRGLFKGYPKFDDAYLVGEISDLSGDSGNLYFAVQAAYGDEKIQCLVWEQDRDGLDIDLQRGMVAAVRGTLQFYEGGGHPTCHVDEIHLVGESAYWHRIEQLEQTLEAEGLFADEQKASLPEFPATVGIVTAADSDAEQDVIETLHSRYPDVEVLVRDSPVQGTDAASELARAVRELDSEPIEVLIITRGGGSTTALRPFNEEPIVRTVAEADTPTVSAVGHDADEPLIDRVADTRVKTPTAAGETVVPNKETLLNELADAREAIEHQSTGHLSRWLTDQHQALTDAAEQRTAQWLTNHQLELERSYEGVVEPWLATNRTEISQGSAQTSASWTQNQRHGIQAASQSHIRQWLGAQRTGLEHAYSQLEQQHEFKTEREGLEQRNKILLAVIVALILLFIASEFGVI